MSRALGPNIPEMALPLGAQVKTSAPGTPSKRPTAAAEVSATLDVRSVTQLSVPLKETLQMWLPVIKRLEAPTSARPSPLKSATVKPATELVNLARSGAQNCVPPKTTIH